MKWIGRRESENVEDRRGMSGGGKTLIGGGAIGIIILLLQVFGGETGQTIGNVLQQTQGQQTEQTDAAPLSEQDEVEGKFIRTLVADNEDVWSQIFQENNIQFDLLLLLIIFSQNCFPAYFSDNPT